MTVTSTRWFALCVWLSACVCLGTAEQLQAQGLPPKVIVWQGSANTPAVGHYGILGEVARPGVYSASQELTLQRLVEAAGGLSAQAVPSVRIIRTERAGQSLYFNPTGHDRLQAGDYVVVDRNSAPAMNGEARPADPVIWIGIAGVHSRPVVVPVEPADAQLTTIMVALGQSQELARSARVMLPPGSPMMTSTNYFLPNGTVIAVPPALLVLKHLPKDFQEVQAIAATSPLPPPPSFANVSQPQLVPNPVPVPPPAGQPSDTVGTQPYRTPFDQELSASTVPFSSMPVQDTAASPASLPAPGSRLAPTITAPPPPDAGPVSITANLTANLDQQESSGAADIVGEMSIPKKSATFNAWQMLGIAGTVASLVGVALGTRQYLDHTTTPAKSPLPARNTSRISPEMFAEAAERAAHLRHPPVEPNHEPAKTVAAPAPAPPPPVIRESLSDILQRKTPIQQEGAELPHAVRLHARPIKAETIYGVDPLHDGPPNAPHLPVAELAPIDLKLEVDQPAEPFLPRPHFALKRTSVVGETEQTEPMQLAAEPPEVSQASALPEPLPEDPRFQSPIERALARLQRGRHA